MSFSKIADVGYLNIPDSRFEGHDRNIQDHPKSLVPVVCAIVSDIFGNQKFHPGKGTRCGQHGRENGRKEKWPNSSLQN
jgi:hypothetical protein